MKEPIKGYKVTDSNMQCRGFQFELNKKYSSKGKLSVCTNGFHFCSLANDCFNYYDFKPENRVFEILAHGEVEAGGDKSCTSEIELIRELTWLEVLTIVNTGKENTGRRNSGDRNSGNWNSGDRNSGDWNSGDCNSGNCNSGDRNSGDCNSGNCNSGDRNSGDCNSGYRNVGAFCTDKNPKVFLFDQPTEILVRDWENHRACQIMANLNPNIWVWSNEMTAEEKKDFPTHETTGGYLKSISLKEAWTNLWGNLNDKDKAVFTSLPHFDSNKFYEITGIKA